MSWTTGAGGGLGWGGEARPQGAGALTDLRRLWREGLCSADTPRGACPFPEEEALFSSHSVGKWKLGQSHLCPLCRAPGACPGVGACRLPVGGGDPGPRPPSHLPGLLGGGGRPGLAKRVPLATPEGMSWPARQGPPVQPRAERVLSGGSPLGCLGRLLAFTLAPLSGPCSPAPESSVPPPGMAQGVVPACTAARDPRRGHGPQPQPPAPLWA